ncbi:MAG: tetratricopeptide repeat protein [Rhodocyclaceae bacterium]|nr:tetratricopeptide repeat protein [Rhodocyclaceae bacterium]
MLIALTALCAGPSAFAGVGAEMRAGNALADKGRYEEALAKYQEALVREPDNVKIHYNIARALYRAGKYPEAVSEYQLCMLTKDAKLQARTMYNIGNCRFRQQRLDDAIAAYTASLLLDPKDVHTKQNLEFCYRKKQEQQDNPSTIPNPPVEASEHAKRMKQLADEAVKRREYRQALGIMNELLKADKTAVVYNDYVKRLGDVVEINP